MIIVADSSPLIAFAILGRLDLLDSLFKKVIVPEAVYDEVTLLSAMILYMDSLTGILSILMALLKKLPCFYRIIMKTLSLLKMI